MEIDFPPGGCMLGPVELFGANLNFTTHSTSVGSKLWKHPACCFCKTPVSACIWCAMDTTIEQY